MVDNSHSTTTFSPVEQSSKQQSISPRGRLLIASCRSGSYLAEKVVEQYEEEVAYMPDIDDSFSDSETRVRLNQDVNGDDIFLFQSLFDPTSERSVDQNYMALFIAARTFQEWGANHVTAVTPYLAYARQDKPTRFKREPTTAKLMADLSSNAGIERVVTWHPHCRQIPGFYSGMPVNALEALALFVEQFRRFEGRDDVIVVAPDAGAAKLVTYFGRELDLKVAIASKYRPRPEQAEVAQIIGDFAGKRVAIVLDDMISSGGTVYTLVKRLVEDEGIEAVYLGVSHHLCMQRAHERLVHLHANYHLQEVTITNSIPQTQAFRSLPFVSACSLAPTLTWVIDRVHHNCSLDEPFYST